MEIRFKQDFTAKDLTGKDILIPANTRLTPTRYNTFIDGNGEWFEFSHPDYLYITLLAIHIEKVYPHPTYWMMTRPESLITCTNEISVMLDSLMNPDTNLTQDMRDTALIEAYQHMQYLALQMSFFAKQYPLPPMKEEQL